MVTDHVESQEKRGMFTWAVKLTRISSTELQRTGSVRSSSAFSNQLLKAEAFLANNRNKSSTLNKTDNKACKWCFFIVNKNDDNNSFKTLASDLCFRSEITRQQASKETFTFLYWSWACWSRSLRVLESSNSCSHLEKATRQGISSVKPWYA